VPGLSAEDIAGSRGDASRLVLNEVKEADGPGGFEAVRLAATWARVSASRGLDPASLKPERIVDRSFLLAM